MGDRRKLQGERRRIRSEERQINGRKFLLGEIDRCLKKVTEGVELFDDIWQKVVRTVNGGAPHRCVLFLRRFIQHRITIRKISTNKNWRRKSRNCNGIEIKSKDGCRRPMSKTKRHFKMRANKSKQFDERCFRLGLECYERFSSLLLRFSKWKDSKWSNEKWRPRPTVITG